MRVVSNCLNLKKEIKKPIKGVEAVFTQTELHVCESKGRLEPKSNQKSLFLTYKTYLIGERNKSKQKPAYID